VGDDVLREVSKRLGAVVREGDFVARLGGDEFVVIAEDVHDDASAIALVDRILSEVGKPMRFNGVSLTVGASAGIALSKSNGEKPLELLRKADFALYRAKQDDTSSIGIYDDALESLLLNKADVERNLEATLARGGDQLRLRYQPIVSSDRGDLVAVEALICWDRPGHGVILPDAFIPIAEETDLIIEIDRWVLHEATKQLVDCSAAPELADISISINVSGRHLLRPGFVGHVKEALAASGLAPAKLTLEMTETVLVSDLERAASQLGAIRELGVRIAIDDFGTGYSSIAHLRGLPIDEIKIDRSLVAGLTNVSGRSLFQLVRDLAQHLGVRTVAEGIESEEQLIILRDLGCTALQGFFFSTPLSPDALLAWARTETRTQAA
jgi:predicted signal transduction protein with EAL and GGDEF domain